MSECRPESHHRSHGHLRVPTATNARAHKRSVESLRNQQHNVVTRSLLGELARGTFGRSSAERPQPLHRKSIRDKDALVSKRTRGTWISRGMCVSKGPTGCRRDWAMAVMRLTEQTEAQRRASWGAESKASKSAVQARACGGSSKSCCRSCCRSCGVRRAR